MKLVIIGGGNMGGAIATSLVKKQALPADDLVIVEMSAERRTQLSEDLGCSVTETFDERLSEADAVLIAVKPQVCEPLMSKIAPMLQESAMVISIMAGISVDQIEKGTHRKAVVRVMPNTPAQIGEGVSAIYPSPAVTSEQVNAVKKIFESNGPAIVCESEDQIDVATAISGGGPAFVFYLAEQMIASATQLGFSKSDADLLVKQTIKGSALLWEDQGLPPDELRRRVTSPKGTTEAAIGKFDSENVGKNLQAGFQAAYNRAKELANQ